MFYSHSCYLIAIPRISQDVHLKLDRSRRSFWLFQVIIRKCLRANKYLSISKKVYCGIVLFLHQLSDSKTLLKNAIICTKNVTNTT